MTDLILSQQIEALLVSRNPRNMKTLQAALEPGYYLRAARHIQRATGNILIGTGFPVEDTFETDGPVGAIALYRAISKLGGHPVLVCGAPLAEVLKDDFNVYQISVGRPELCEQEAQVALDRFDPSLVISIERPGLAQDGTYRNIRGEDISQRCASFDYFLNLAPCTTIAIGDGGNEIGMGNIMPTLAHLNITASVTRCDELLIADVSNWAAHGLIALLAYFSGEDLLADWHNIEILSYLSSRGSVDGISRQNTLTEDGLDSSITEDIIVNLRKITGFC